MKTFLTIDQLTKTYYRSGGPFRALNGISLDVQRGDFITIVGGNGAGKSTLLNAIAGTLTVETGRLIMEGDDVTDSDEAERAAAIGRVFQDPLMGTAPRMTVLENLALAAKRGKRRRLRPAVTAEFREMMAEKLQALGLSLEARLDTEMGALSGGQRQSIALLMATLNAPHLLLLDEHTAALDPRTSKRVLALTDQIIRDQHLTALMITHQLKDALTYGNRLIVLAHGRVAYDFDQEQKAQLTAIKLYGLINQLAEA